MPWIDVAASATANRPSDGRGGTDTTAAGAYTTDDTVFTATGYTAAAGGTSGLSNMAVGAVIATSDGFYGIVTAFTVGAVVIDEWRKWGFPGGRGIPAANSDIKCYPSFFGKGQERVIIDSIEIRTPAAVAVSILDLYGGTTLKTMTCAAGNPFVFPTNWGGPLKEGETGWPIHGPFTVTTGAGLAVTVNYRLLSAR